MEVERESHMVSINNMKPDVGATHLQKLRLCMFTFFYFYMYSRITFARVLGDSIFLNRWIVVSD